MKKVIKKKINDVNKDGWNPKNKPIRDLFIKYDDVIKQSIEARKRIDKEVQELHRERPDIKFVLCR